MSEKLYKAYAQKQTGGPEVLTILELPKPTATGTDLLVKVIATALNPVDYKVRRGYGQERYPRILGFDGAGIVEEIGEKVSKFKVGDEVYFAGDISRQGAHAEYVLIDERITGKKPKTLSWIEAASVPLCVLTAWELLVEEMGIRAPSFVEPNLNANKSLLIIGGAGGVGSIAIQIAKKILRIGNVIATASRPETIAWCKKLGADTVINHNNLKENLAKIGISGVNYVFSTVDVFTVFDSIVEITKAKGRIGGITGWSELDLSNVFRKSITLVTEMMFARPSANEEPEKQGVLLNTVADLIDEGVLVHTLNHVFEWKQLPEAHKLQESGKAIGKIGLIVQF